MNNVKSNVILCFCLFIGLFLILTAGCKKKDAIEPAGNDKEAARPDDQSYEVFERYKQYAQAGEPYPDQPGKGKTLGFANIYGTQPFCINVEESIIRHAKLAGFDEKNIIIMDNQYNPVLGLKNADIMLSKRPDVFIEFQADEKVNHIVAEKFKAAGIPIIAIDVPVPGAPFMGIDNWHVATLGGKEMARLIEGQWGGWDAVDLVVLVQNPAGGEMTMKRSEGFAAALVEIFGQQAEEKIVRTDGGMGQSEQAKSAMDNVLASHPSAKKTAVTALNEQMLAGVIASLQVAGRWKNEDIIAVSLGLDPLGQSQIRDGTADLGIAFFPEKYGEYVIPAACAILNGRSVPAEMFIENMVITKENIDEYYPVDEK